MYGVIAIAFRSCLDRGEHAAMEKLEYLKAVFSEEGAEGVGEKLDSTDRDTLRTVTVAAGLSLRAGGKRRSVAELRSAWRSILPVRRARMRKRTFALPVRRARSHKDNSNREPNV